MNKVSFLYALKSPVELAVADLRFGTSVQKGDTEQKKRAPEVHLMRLPDGTAAYKYAPYVIIQLISGKQSRDGNGHAVRKATVRFIFCVYNQNGEEGSLELLNLIESVESAILKAIKFGACFTLDTDEPFETLIYPDETRDYYFGESVGVFHLPPIEQEVNLFEEKSKYQYGS